MPTTISLTPATDRVRKCSAHQDRKATHVRIVKSDKPEYTAYIPECPDCSTRKLPVKYGRTLAVKPIKSV